MQGRVALGDTLFHDEEVGRPGMTVRTSTLAALALLAVAPFAAAAPAAPEATWVVVQAFGALDVGEGVAVDEEGNVVVTGIVDLGGDEDVATVRFDRTGAVVWSRILDLGPRDRGEDVVLDRDGGAVVLATTRGLGGDDALLVRYGADGSQAWRATLDKGTSEVGRGVALASDGGFVVAGTSISFHGTDAFLAKFTPAGNETWARAFNLYALDEAFDVAATPDGGAVVVGRVVRDGTFDTLLARYSPDGEKAWHRILDERGRDEARGVAVDAGGDVFVVGTATADAAEGSHLDVVVRRFTAAGAPLWSRMLDVGGGDDEGRDVVLDASGNLLVTGFGLVGTTRDPFLAKLDPSGREVWRQTIPGPTVGGTGAVAGSPGGTRFAATGAVEVGEGDFDWFVAAFDERGPRAELRGPPGAVAAGQTVGFTDASSPGDVPIVSWTWDFGDGTTGTGPVARHAYAAGGAYVVRLVVHDAWGNTAVATTTVAVAGTDVPEEARSPAPAVGLALAAALGAALLRRRR